MFGRANELLNHFNFSRSHLIDIHEKLRTRVTSPDNQGSTVLGD